MPSWIDLNTSRMGDTAAGPWSPGWGSSGWEPSNVVPVGLHPTIPPQLPVLTPGAAPSIVPLPQRDQPRNQPNPIDPLIGPADRPIRPIGPSGDPLERSIPGAYYAGGGGVTGDDVYHGGGIDNIGVGDYNPYHGGGVEEYNPYHGGGDENPYHGGGDENPYHGGGDENPYHGADYEGTVSSSSSGLNIPGSMSYNDPRMMYHYTPPQQTIVHQQAYIGPGGGLIAPGNSGPAPSYVIGPGGGMMVNYTPLGFNS